ncbi:MAG: UDP-N-acetylglucosamine 2-epimerase (non-hydrolyzing) [bacterium]|nr:UDP-N-acetylglucosamine 2-epimerase (non-hydrolyzing) [bacterium]
MNNLDKYFVFVVGTRPELIKMAPVIKQFKNNHFKTLVLSTSQHKELLYMANKVFNIEFDIDLDIMQPNQDLFDISINVLSKIKDFLNNNDIEFLFIQGDTSTAFLVALAAFYINKNIKIAHVEAGLRSFDKYQPFPEEINRKLISHIADYHFAPTTLSAQNLYNEGIKQNVFITGNTVVDALISIQDKINNVDLSKYNVKENEFILVEVHRRESFGQPMIDIMEAIKEIAIKANVKIIFPVHYNPNVRNVAFKVLSELKELVYLIEPVDYLTMLAFIKNAKLIITDSGGIQEEAPTFKTPVFVVRNVTERPEGIKEGFIFIASNNKNKIVNTVLQNFNKKQELIKSNKPNPYGDGLASKRIFDIISKSVFLSS